VSDAEAGARGWWFKAIAQDESCTLQGNLRLEWDAQARVWRPQGGRDAASPEIPLPPSMRGVSSAKRKQLD
jgi:hypothetical protein